jgi:S-DNA-T family DNA segregation ATPase FtsK/SpoIIIE
VTLKGCEGAPEVHNLGFALQQVYMARKRTNTRKSPFWKRLYVRLDSRLREEIVGLLLMAVGGITLLNLLSVSHAQGLLIDRWSLLLRQIFGWGAFLVVPGMIALGILLLLRNLQFLLEVRQRRIAGGLLLLFTFLGLLHFFSLVPDSFLLARNGGGGGYIGWGISEVLYTLIGDIGAFLAFCILTAVGVVLVAALSPSDVRDGAMAVGKGTASLYQRYVAPYLRNLTAGQRVAEEPREVIHPAPHVAEQKASHVTVPAAPMEEVEPIRERARKQVQFPPLELLEPTSAQALSEAEVRRKLSIIEETLESFGVPAKVVEVNQGPTVTQFGVEPGYVERRGRDGQAISRKVRVSKISSLSKDLALALAAAPIRIEAPVPGRPVVGIEVPNDTTSLVSLRAVMESEELQRMRSSLKVALGQDVSGRPVVADLGIMPHLLIAGATGSGKSVCINSIVTCLLFNNDPQQLKLLMIDPKSVELIHFNGLPHLVARAVTDMEEVLRTLRWVMAEMDRRYAVLSHAKARNIDHYNRKKLPPGQQPLPYIVVAIDELADLMMMAPDEVERILCRLAQMSRATGIHLIVATQRPSVDVVTGLIKANFPARISFAVTSQVDSRVILDTGGAETLLGHGDMLYVAPDSAKLVRIQGCFVSDQEIQKVVQFWKKTSPLTLEQIIPPWHGMTSVADEEEEERDDLLEEAIAIIEQQERASTSLLQRRLRIGYPRAARIMDQLEEDGIVGPPESGGRWREVLIGNEEEEMSRENWD